MARQHPSLDAIASLLDGTAPEARRRTVRGHLDAGCARCRAQADGFGTVLQDLRLDPLTRVPQQYVHAALAQLTATQCRVGAHQAARPGIARAAALVARTTELLSNGAGVAGRIARLALDSAAMPTCAAAAGVRAGGMRAPMRHLVYEQDEDRYTLRIRREASDASYEVMGQILGATPTVPGTPVQLCPETGAPQRAACSPTGEFSFDGIRPGRYQVVIDAPGGAVTLTGLDLP